MRPGDKLHTLEGTQGVSTGKAIQFTVEYIDDVELEKPMTEWFPFSQVTKMFKNPDETECDSITVKEWILEQKGMMKFLGDALPKSTPAPVKVDKHGFDDMDDDIPF